MSRAKNWVFTLNNYTDDDQVNLRRAAETPQITFLVFGREVGENGTPHLQGYVEFASRLRLNQAKRLLNQRAHLEVRRGTAQEARDYCVKDEDFEEYGEISQGMIPRILNLFPINEAA